MCGIIGYIGNQKAFPIALKGLKKLEYRGYDSAGIATISNNKLETYKKAGKVKALEQHTRTKNIESNIAIGHTRWATHGEVNDANAHPHTSNSNKVSIIHNGIIENYNLLKKDLLDKGYVFNTDTDTEVLANLIENTKKNNNCSLFEAVRLAFNQTEGSNAVVVLSEEEPDKIIAARSGSPLVIGISSNEKFLASDITPIIEYTNKVVFLENNQIATITKDNYELKSLSNTSVYPNIKTVEQNISNFEKGDYDHFMLKEIFEQDVSIKSCLIGRISNNQNSIILPELEKNKKSFLNAKRIIFLSCGSSSNSALYGKYIIEEIARIPVSVENSSEFKYRNPVLNNNDVVFAISQSGETADTLGALEHAKNQGIPTFAITNVKNSSITRLVDDSIFTNCGPEISVASTKALTSQLVILNLISCWVADKKNNSSTKALEKIIKDLLAIPNYVTNILQNIDEIKSIAKKLSKYNNAFFLGRWVNFPIALEGALKLKEISYIHAEGYSSAEMKHGPLSLIDKNFPVIYIIPNDKVYEKNISSIQEIKARGGNVISIISGNGSEAKELSDFYIEVPKTSDILTPLINVIPLQLLAYFVALERNCDIDMPKNLAKSVTVE